MKYALIENGIVKEVVDKKFPFAESKELFWIEYDDSVINVEVTDKYNDGKFSPRHTKEEYINESVTTINTIASSKIEALYPAYKQRNVDREALMFKENTSKQQAQLDMHDFIEDIRSKAQALEESVMKMPESDLKAFNPYDESNWS